MSTFARFRRWTRFESSPVSIEKWLDFHSILWFISHLKKPSRTAVPSGVSQSSPKIVKHSRRPTATCAIKGKRLFGGPTGSSPISPLLCAPTGLKYLEIKDYIILYYIVNGGTEFLTDTDEDWKLVHSRKRPEVDTLFSSVFPTRPSDEYDSAPSRKYSRPLLDVFACIG